MRGHAAARSSLLGPDEELLRRMAIIASTLPGAAAAQAKALDELRAGRIEMKASSKMVGELERAVATAVMSWSTTGTVLSTRTSSGLRLLVQLLSHTCSVATLGRIFALCAGAAREKDEGAKRLLLALEIGVKQSQGPTRYLALRGARCALQLPLAPTAWPSSGLTFSVLFRCEGQAAGTGVRLLHATGTGADGGAMELSVVLRGGDLIVAVVAADQRARLATPGLAPRPGAWHWLSIAIHPHSAMGALLGGAAADNVLAYLDAETESPCLSGTAPYPAAQRVGNIALGDSPDAADPGMTLEIGAVVLYGSALDAAAVAAAHRSGGAGWSSGRAADLCGTPFASQPALRRAALIAYDLRCWSAERKSCADCAEARRSDERAARVVGEQHRARIRARTPPTVAMFRLGGARHLIALLRRAQAAPRAIGEVETVAEKEEPNVTLAEVPPPLLGAASFAQALSLIAVVLRYSPMQRQQYLLGGRGLASTAQALQRLPPTYLSTRLVDAAAAVVDALQRSAQSAATAAAEVLLFDFRVWQRAPRESTLHLLDVVEGCARRGPPALTAAIAAAKLRACYRTREAGELICYVPLLHCMPILLTIGLAPSTILLWSFHSRGRGAHRGRAPRELPPHCAGERGGERRDGRSARRARRRDAGAARGARRGSGGAPARAVLRSARSAASESKRRGAARVDAAHGPRRRGAHARPARARTAATRRLRSRSAARRRGGAKLAAAPPLLRDDGGGVRRRRGARARETGGEWRCGAHDHADECDARHASARESPWLASRVVCSAHSARAGRRAAEQQQQQQQQQQHRQTRR